MSYLGLESIRRGNTAQCIQDIFQLHFPGAESALDCTYGAGRFWKWDHEAILGHPLRITGVDIDPPGPVDVVADYRSLPFPERSFDVMCFDPPFIFSKGLRRVIGTKRFFMGAEAARPEDRTHSGHQLHMPRNPTDLLTHYRRVFEQSNIARQGLICKGQDLITGTNRDFWSFNVIDMAINMGIGYPSDYLLQMSPAPRMKDPRWRVQKNFRTRHCTYLVWKW